MRLLIITQKMDQNDSVLGFMHGWVEMFSQQMKTVTVVCLEKGRVNLPVNVEVYSLGKEKLTANSVRLSAVRRFVYAWRFVRYIVRFRNEYDAVFVHMNPEYILLGGFFWKLWRKTVALWYAHKSVPWHLRVAHFFTDIVFTSTTSGFRLPSSKVRVIGQGIDVDRFKISDLRHRNERGAFKIVSVGRITQSKDYDTLIEAMEKLRQATDTPLVVDIFGPTSNILDEQYLRKLKERIIQKGLENVIFFRGAVANKDLPEVLAQYSLFVNMGLTGSLDKAVPEAMAVGMPILTCNEAFKAVLGPFTDVLMYEKGDVSSLARLIEKMIKLSFDEREKLGQDLRSLVVKDHSLQTFIKKITESIEALHQ